MSNESKTSNTSSQSHDFEGVKSRLEEIADAVSDESLPLDEALDLFDEAVSLGLKISDFVEEGIVVDEPEETSADADATLAGADADANGDTVPSVPTQIAPGSPDAAPAATAPATQA